MLKRKRDDEEQKQANCRQTKKQCTQQLVIKLPEMRNAHPFEQPIKYKYRTATDYANSCEALKKARYLVRQNEREVRKINAQLAELKHKHENLIECERKRRTYAREESDAEKAFREATRKQALQEIKAAWMRKHPQGCKNEQGEFKMRDFSQNA